jgi:DNA-binding MltR family transcriptional regulator
MNIGGHPVYYGKDRRIRMKPPDESPANHWWDLADIKEFYDESPDRGLAISLPAIIDNRLTSILRLAMRDDDRLFNELLTGPLGNFGTKIKLVYMLGMINEEIYQDLKLIHKIRNEFAHKVEIKQLDQHPISAWIKSMKVYQAVARLSKTLSPDGDSSSTGMTADKFVRAVLNADLTTMRDTFRTCIMMMIVRLNKLETSLTTSRREFEEKISRSKL